MGSFIALAIALADAHQADIAMTTCFYTQAAALDDRISSADVIAEGVASACSHQIRDWKYDNYLELRPLDAQTFYRGLDKMVPRMATEIVLRVRAAAKR